MRLLGLLAERGDRPRGLIRDPRQADDLRAAGAEPVLADLETDDLTPHLHAADAFVFSAGAGGGSPERTLAVDRDAAIRAIGAAQAANVRRWVMVSSIWVHDPSLAPQSLRHYMQAKAAADSALSASGLDWTVVRAGLLTDEPGTGTVRTSTELGGNEQVSRDDVALVLAECLHQPATIGKTFELFDGTDPVTEALESLQAGRDRGFPVRARVRGGPAPAGPQLRRLVHGRDAIGDDSPPGLINEDLERCVKRGCWRSVGSWRFTGGVVRRILIRGGAYPLRCSPGRCLGMRWLRVVLSALRSRWSAMLRTPPRWLSRRRQPARLGSY